MLALWLGASAPSSPVKPARSSSEGAARSGSAAAGPEAGLPATYSGLWEELWAIMPHLLAGAAAGSASSAALLGGDSEAGSSCTVPSLCAGSWDFSLCGPWSAPVSSALLRLLSPGC